MKDYTKINFSQQTPNNPQKSAPKKKGGIKAYHLILIVVVMCFLRITIESRTVELGTHKKQTQAIAQASYTAPKADGSIIISKEVRDAYKASNVEYVEFSTGHSKLSDDEKRYFTELFKYTDEMVMERVDNYGLLAQGKQTHLEVYKKNLAAIEKIQVPANLKEPHQMIITGIRYQMSYFDYLNLTKNKFNTEDPAVKKSYQNLYGASQLFAKKLKHEDPRNIYSIDRHLCALDLS